MLTFFCHLEMGSWRNTGPIDTKIRARLTTVRAIKTKLPSWFLVFLWYAVLFEQPELELCVCERLYVWCCFLPQARVFPTQNNSDNCMSGFAQKGFVNWENAGCVHSTGQTSAHSFYQQCPRPLYIGLGICGENQHPKPVLCSGQGHGFYSGCAKRL